MEFEMTNDELQRLIDCTVDVIKECPPETKSYMMLENHLKELLEIQIGRASTFVVNVNSVKGNEHILNSNHPESTRLHRENDFFPMSVRISYTYECQECWGEFTTDCKQPKFCQNCGVECKW